MNTRRVRMPTRRELEKLQSIGAQMRWCYYAKDTRKNFLRSLKWTRALNRILSRLYGTSRQ